MIRLFATLNQGVHLYFCLFLALMADFVFTSQQGEQRYIYILFNLDKLVGNQIMWKKILKLLHKLKVDTSIIFFLVSFPQIMLNNKAFADVLLYQYRPNYTLLSGMINEAHICADHGSSLLFNNKVQ